MNMRFFVLFAVFVFSSFAQVSAQEAPASDAPTAAPVVESAKPEKSDGEYEIDYEEEEGADASADVEPPPPEPEPTPEPPVKGKKAGKKIVDKGAGSQGSRAKDRPNLKAYIPSDTFSVYKKEGKAIRVDTD